MNITYDTHFHSHPINTSKERELGCSEEILTKIESSINAMIDKHCKVFAVRFDLRYPNDNIVCENDAASKKISSFVYNFNRSLKREQFAGGHCIDPKLIHVSEQESSNNRHHHCLVLVNGNAKKNAHAIHEKANKLWKQALHSDSEGLVDYCNRHKNGIMIDRNSAEFDEQYDLVFHQASYLAKVRGKEKRKKGSWLVSSTRI